MNLISAEMIGDMDLEVKNSKNMELRWKLVKRGRSSRKSSGRGLNSPSKLGDFTSPKSVGDLSGSDSHKLDDGLLMQSSSGKLDSVPIKKRKHLLRKDYIYPHPSPSFKDNEKLNFTRCSSGDFSGIELLAAAASMDDEFDMCGNEILGTEESLLKPKISGASSHSPPPEILARSNGSDKASIHMTRWKEVDSECASQSLCRSTASEILHKAVNREHWDLNILMDAWDEPCDPMAGLKELDDNAKMSGLTESHEHIVLNEAGDASAKPDISRLGEDNLVIVSSDETCIKFSSMETQHVSDSIANSSDQGNKTTDKGFSRSADDQYLWFDSNEKTRDQTINTDVKRVFSFSSEPCTSSTSVTDRKVQSSCGGADISKNDVFPCDSSDTERSGTSAKSHSTNQTPILQEMTGPAELQCQGSKDSCAFQDVQSLLVSESKDQINRSFAFVSEEACSQDHSPLTDFVPCHEDKNLPFEEPMTNAAQGSNKSSIPGALDKPTNFDGMLDSTKNTQQDSVVSQVHYSSMVQGGNSTAVEEDHDSPYEDGELRGSCMYSWEENECVDYESDGRNEDENDMDNCHLSVLADGISEISHRMERRNLVSKGYPEVEERKRGPFEPYLMSNFVTDDCDNDELGGKSSNAGSGTTVEQPMEMMDENGDSMKRRQFANGAFDVKMEELIEHASSKPWGKLQSCIDGRTGMDARDRNGSFFKPSFRSRQHETSYSRFERDIIPNKYMGRYRSNHGAKDEAQWSSRTLNCHASDYLVSKTHGPSRPRKSCNNTSERYCSSGKDFLDSRQNDTYLSRDLQSFGSRRSSIEREDYVGVRTRMSVKQGASNFRSRHSDRDFEAIAQPRGDNGFHDRFRNRNFSQYSGRVSHIHSPSRSSYSRSRSQSPRMRYHAMGRKHSRSPNYRPDTQMHRSKERFYKPTFAASREEGYMSASRGHFFPQENYRFIKNSDFDENHVKRRRSPVRVFKRPQRFDDINSPTQLKSDEYCRSGYRPERSSFMASRRGKFSESDYSDRRRDGSDRMIR